MPILSHTTTAAVPEAALVPLTDPVPIYRWRMLWRRSLRHPALAALRKAIDRAHTRWDGSDAAVWPGRPRAG